MKTLIKNAIVITMDNGKIYNNGSILVEDAVISYVGDAIDVPDDCDRVIDAKGGIVMPGLVNAHTHSPMSLL